ncbi:copper amine oxidase N-terminal domain-containing protein [Bacillus sp. FJAT-28004]|uniref:copper amine oxidase N-terminal domain-containing protein n=1 Tax=Bacillus sp. FJAT-28004 TaxID=1679165 RepID=UPI0007C74AD3|nr:copper amine oxidase N-terminal domain-containing protein [Bacillus sp. FJAT-28004]
MMKKWMKATTAALTIAGVLSAGSATMAASAPKAPIKMFIDGRLQDDVLNVNGRTMVQLKAFNDPEKLKYSYETATKTIVIKNPDRNLTVRLKDGLKSADVNGEKVPLDAPVTVKKGRTYVPVRFVTETLGGTVGPDSTGKQIIVRTPSGEERFKTLRNGDLTEARKLAIHTPGVDNGMDIAPYGEGFTFVYTFPQGEALRYTMKYRGLITYYEINDSGISERKWQKDLLGKNGEAGNEPKPFGDSVYFSEHLMLDWLKYGTIDSAGKQTELGSIDRYTNKEYANVTILPIEGEVRTDMK